MHKSTRDQIYQFGEVEGGAKRGVMKLGFSKTDAVGVVASLKQGKGLHVPPHRHADWIAVTVVSGRVRVTQRNGSEECIYEAGDTYLVEPGDVHSETALEDTHVVVVAGPGVAKDKWSFTTITVEEE